LTEFASLASRHADVMAWQPASEAPADAAADAAQDTLGVATFAASPAGAPGGTAGANAAAAAQAGKPHVLLVFGEHAREVITSDTALWLARVLTGASRLRVCDAAREGRAWRRVWLCAGCGHVP
jgi:hypothetical protein